MRNAISHRSHTSVVSLALALAALFVAIGGPAAAADAARAGSALITGKQVKNGSLDSRDIKDGALQARDFKAGQVPTGPQGPRGDAGPAGERGPEGQAGPQGPAGTAPAPEGWRTVGAAGQPPFVASAAATWAIFDDAHNPAGFYKDPFGVVHLKGIVSCSGSDCANSQGIFTLPPGYRPARREVQMGISHNGTATVPARISVSTSGLVWRSSELGGTSWLSLDGITFRAFN